MTTNVDIEERAEAALAVLAGHECSECKVALDENGQCTACKLAHCPYCGIVWNDACEHFIGADTSNGDSWGNVRPWPNEAFVIPAGIDIGTSPAARAALIEAIEAIAPGLGEDLAEEIAEAGGEESTLSFWFECVQLPIQASVCVENHSNAMGGDSWSTYWGTDDDRIANDIFADELQDLLDSLPARFPCREEKDTLDDD